MITLAIVEPSPTDWMTAWGSIAGAVGLFITAIVAMTIAIYGDSLKRRAFRPKLDVMIEMAPPYCHKVQLIEGLTVGATVDPNAEVMPPIPDSSSAGNRRIYETYYFRLGITNHGNSVATAVGVRLLGLHKWDDMRHAFVADEDFRPFNLRWSHVRGVWLPRIEPQLMRFCDLAHVFKDAKNLLLEFDTEVTPGQVRRGVWPTKKPRGEYRVDLAITADNAYLLRKSVRIKYSAEWHEEAADMFRRGMQINILP